MSVSCRRVTETTQPLLLTASIALWKLWKEKGGIDPSHLAGHSLGEWSALVCADVLEFSDAVEIVKQRGALMQSAVPEVKPAPGDPLHADVSKSQEYQVLLVASSRVQSLLVASSRFQSLAVVYGSAGVL